MYRLRNWSEYNKSLKARGSLTIWMSEDVIANWESDAHSLRRGAPRRYSDSCIAMMSTLGSLFRLAGRQTGGFVRSVFDLMKIDYPVPDHSTVSRRVRQLDVSLSVTPSEKARHVVVDSTGIKVFGEGEWKTRQHSVSKRRTWRKLHIGVDDQSQEIVASVVTTNDFKDSQLLEDLLDQVEGPLAQVSADGAYDSSDCYNTIEQRGAVSTIPPRKDAKIWQHGNCKKPPHPRDQNLRAIRRMGRKKWKRDSGYHQRSLSETAMYRLKTIFGGHVRGRLFDTQATELLLRCAALNKMTQLGMPDSIKINL